MHCRADHTICYETNPGFKTRVKELTGGKGCDVIFDPVGGAVFDESMPSCCAYGCRFLLCGFTSGELVGCVLRCVVLCILVLCILDRPICFACKRCSCVCVIWEGRAGGEEGTYLPLEADESTASEGRLRH